MAIHAGVEIVPVAMEQYGKKYYVNIGENIDLGGYDISQRKEATDLLRDILCTLKWEIWERYGKALRKDIPEEYIKMFLAHYENYTYDVYTLEDVRNTRYHPKTPSPEEAFGFMGRLIPGRANAFLLRESRRWTGGNG